MQFVCHPGRILKIAGARSSKAHALVPSHEAQTIPYFRTISASLLYRPRVDVVASAGKL
jgi:hypothetical protein